MGSVVRMNSKLIRFVEEIPEFRVIEHLHATDLDTFFRCPRKFKYSKIDRLKSDRTEEYFDIGTLGHKTLEAHYAKEDPFNVINSIENGEWKQLIRTLYEGYREHYKNEKPFQVASLENEIKLVLPIYHPLTGVYQFSVEIIFTIDVLALYDDGYAILDHKFYSKLPEESTLKLDIQPTFYLWACRRLGLSVKRYWLNVIRKSPPTMPQLLASGKGLSKAQNNLAQTTYELYLEAIKGFGLNVSDYTKELDFLQQRGSIVYKRYPTTRSDRELDSFEKQLNDHLYTIHSPLQQFHPQPGLDCPKCAFHFLCNVENDRGDIETTKKAMFQKKADNER